MNPVKIGILSRDRQLYTTKRLLWTVKEIGHDPIFMDTLKISLMVRDTKFEVYYDEENLGQIDVVLGRVGASITDYGLAVIRHFELGGTPVVNAVSVLLMFCMSIIALGNLYLSRKNDGK